MYSEILSKISDAELRVLRLLWQEKRPLTMAEMRAALTSQTGWEGSTVKTFVYRLVEKGALRADKRSPVQYAPLVDEAEYGQYATGALIDKLYGGSAKNLIAALVSAKSLDDADLDELRAMFKVGE